MKTLLKPYILDFLKKQGYKYFLSKKLSSNPEYSGGNIVLTPVIRKPALTGPFIGFDNCFHISGCLEEMDLQAEENKITVFLSRKDICDLKKYLLKLF